MDFFLLPRCPPRRGREASLSELCGTRGCRKASAKRRGGTQRLTRHAPVPDAPGHRLHPLLVSAPPRCMGRIDDAADLCGRGRYNRSARIKAELAALWPSSDGRSAGSPNTAILFFGWRHICWGRSGAYLAGPFAAGPASSFTLSDRQRTVGSGATRLICSSIPSRRLSYVLSSSNCRQDAYVGKELSAYPTG